MNKIKIYEGMISLSENKIITLVKVVLKDSTILITAYNKKLRFTTEELLVHLNVINKSKELEQIYYQMQQPFNNINYNLKECFKYIKEFITLTTQGLMFKCQQLQNYINPTLDQSTKTIQKFLNKQLTRHIKAHQIIHEPITKPMVVIKLGQNNYATLFQKNDLLYLKFHQAKTITNLIQYHKIIASKFGKICQENFTQIFDVSNNNLSYTELAQFYIEISKKKQEKTIPMSKYHQSAKVIQKHIRNYLLFRQVQIYQLRNSFLNLITKAKLISGIGYYLQLSIEIDNQNNQQIFIRAKPIEHSLRFYKILAFKQKLFLNYTEAQLRMGGSIMLQNCQIQQIKSMQKVKTIMFEHAIGLLRRSNEFNDRDPTIDKRILISRSIQDKYKIQQFAYSECGSTFNFDNLKYEYLISKVQIQYRKHQLQKEYEFEQGLNFQCYSDYSVPPINLFSTLPDTSSISSNSNSKKNHKEIDLNNNLIYLSQSGKNGIKIKHYIDPEQQNFLIILEQLLNRCSCKISLVEFQSEYLLKLVRNLDKTKIYRFLKGMLNKLDNLIFLRSSILEIHLEQFNLKDLLQDSMIVKIQKQIRILHFHNSLLRRAQSLLLRVSIELSQNQFHRTIYRLKGNTLRILYNKQVYCLDLNELQTISPQQLNTNKKEYFYILKQLVNFSEFINSDMNIQDISYYRLKFNFLINLIQDHTIYKNGFLDFSLKLPIKLTLKENIARRPLIKNKREAIQKIQQFFKKQFHKNQIRFILKTKSKITFKTRSIRKIGQFYYIIYGSKDKSDLSFQLIQYKCSNQRLKITEKKRNQMLLNLGQQSLLKFYISKLTFKGDQLVFQFQDLTQIDLYEKHKSRKSDKSKRQYQTRLIDVKRSGNQTYNVVYSQRKICSQSIDCIKVDINMNKFKYLYKSVSAKKDTLQTIADNSLKSITYQDDKVYVDKSLIMPSRLKLSQKPQFKINIEKVVRRNPRMENLVKTTVRFNRMKYLLQVNYQSSKINQIIPEAMDTVYQSFEQNFIISSINFEDKTSLEWNLSYEDAQKLTEQSDKYKIAEILKLNLQILNNRFLFLTQKDSDLNFDDVLIMNEISIRKMQRYCMNRTFRKNYNFYRFIRQKYKKYYLLQINQLRSKNQYLVFAAEDQVEQKLFLYIWELVKFQLITIELPKNNYLSFWNQNKVVCVKALLQLIVISENKVFLKKINQLCFKHIFEQIS